MKVFFEIAQDLAERPENEPYRNELKYGFGYGSEGAGRACVLIDNVARDACFTASHFDGHDCIFCKHAKSAKGLCELDFDLLLASVSKKIVLVTIHEMLHVLGCDENQVVAGTDMLGEEFGCEVGCPNFSSVSESEAIERYDKARGRTTKNRLEVGHSAEITNAKAVSTHETATARGMS